MFIPAPRGEGPGAFIGRLLVVVVLVPAIHLSGVRLPPPPPCGAINWARYLYMLHFGLGAAFASVVAAVLMAEASRCSIGVVQCSLQPGRG